MVKSPVIIIAMNKLITKQRLAVWLLVCLTIPWKFGGKEQVAILVDFLLLVLASFLLLRSPEIKSTVVKGPMWLPFAFLSWASLSLIWSVNRYQTVVWLEITGLAIVAFLLACSFGRIKQLRNEWLNGYQLIATITAMWGIFIYLTQSYDRLTSSFYLANPLAAYLLPACLLSLWQFAKTGRKLAVVYGSILGAALVLADSRSAFVMLGLVLAVGIATRPKAVQVFRTFGLIGVVILLVGSANLARANLFHQDTVTQGARFSELTKESSTSGSDRINYLKSTFDIWKQYPVLGTGAGTFGSVHPKYQHRVISASTNAHNFYAQTLAELGLVGGLLIAGVVLALGAVVVKSFRAKADRILALVLAVMVLHLGIDIDAAYPSIMVIVGTMSGFLVANVRRSQNNFVKHQWPLVFALGLSVVAIVPAWGGYVSRGYANSALLAQDDGDYAEASELYALAHTGTTYDPDVLTARGINHLTLGAGYSVKPKAEQEYGKAKQLALRAQRLDLYDAQHLLLQARVLLKEKDFDAAEKVYRHILVLDPYNHPEYYGDLVYLYLQKNSFEKALMTANKVLLLYTPSVVANRSLDRRVPVEIAKLYYYRAIILQGTDLKQTRADVKMSLLLKPDNQAAQLLLDQLTRS